MTSVAFDPWRCDDKNYRFGSVGEDRRLCLWDFSVGMLHRPRGGGGGAAAKTRHGSIASRGTVLARAETQESEVVDGVSGIRPGSGAAGSFAGPHPVEPRASTAMLPPVLIKVVDADPLSWLEFTEDAIMTSCKSGMSLFCSFWLSILLLCMKAQRASLCLSFVLFLSALEAGDGSLLLGPRRTSVTDRFCSASTSGHIRTWNRPSDSTAQIGETSAS